MTLSPDEPRFSWGRLLRLCTFQIGSAMGDILVTSIWNRVMILNFGLPALPIGLLIALRYLLSPLSLYAGFRSDTTPLFGYRRTTYIWLGRGLMVLSFPLLGLSVARFEAARNDTTGWLIAVLCFLMYGTGTLLSGSPFLALVRDSTPKARQGLALTVCETALILMFPIAAITFSLVLREFTMAGFWELVIATMLIGAFFWIFAIVGIEKRVATVTSTTAEIAVKTREKVQSFRDTFGKIWADRRARAFLGFLALATLSAWAQDAILEPFGGEVLGQALGQTTRYSAYWQGATAIVLIAVAVLWRKRRPEEQSRVAQIGLGIMGLGMALLGLVALGAQARWVVLPLVVFGVGFGIYTFGGFSLMVVMTSDREAGTYLGLWAVTILLSRGVGITLGSGLRDGLTLVTNSHALVYATIFMLEALGLLISIYLLTRVNILSFARDTGRVAPPTVPAIVPDLS